MQYSTDGHLAEEILDILRPSKFIILILPSFILLFLILSSLIIREINSTNITNGEIVYLQDEIYFIVSDFFDPEILISTIWTSLTWLVFGSVIYIIGWLVIVAIIDGYNDIVISKYYIHPKSFHNSTYWAAIFGKILLRVSAFILLCGLLYWVMKYALPYSISVLLETIGNSNITFSSDLLNVIILTFILPYIFMLLIQILFLKKHLSS
jgi:hypothetical protein